MFKSTRDDSITVQTTRSLIKCGPRSDNSQAGCTLTPRRGALKELEKWAELSENFAGRCLRSSRRCWPQAPAEVTLTKLTTSMPERVLTCISAAAAALEPAGGGGAVAVGAAGASFG